MTVFVIIFAILLVLLAGFLFTPVSLYIDTDQGRYEIFQTPMLRFFVLIRNGTIVARLQLAGMNIPVRSTEKTRPAKKNR